MLWGHCYCLHEKAEVNAEYKTVVNCNVSWT